MAVNFYAPATPEQVKALADLEFRIDELPESKREFAESLLDQYGSTRGLSQKQWYWVDVLNDLIKNQLSASKEKIGANFSGVFALLHKAKSNKLKYPSIHISAPGIASGEIELSLAGPKSKNAGDVYVTDGRPYGQSAYFGRVTSSGEWVVGKDVKDDTIYHVVSTTLKKLGEDPAGVAWAHGKLTGHCCFCSKPLTDPQSTAAGFGPVCAKHYGLTEVYDSAQPVLADA